MSYRLNRKAYERAKALIESGKYVDSAWSFTAADGNAILGAPRSENWTEYEMWFLGLDATTPKGSKARYGYPFGKGGSLYLSALRAVISRAGGSNDRDIQEAAKGLLDAAQARDANLAAAGATAQGARDVYFTGGTLDIEAELGQGADGAPRLPRFQMVGYTGNPMKLQGKSRPGLNFDYPVVIDLSGLQGLDKMRPILKGHDQSQPVGHTDTLAVVNNELVAAGPVSNPYSPQAMEIVSSSRNGFPWQASIGADIVANEFIPAGQSGEANGRTYIGPVNIARQSVLGEISFVALGADDDTSASIAAARAPAKGSTGMNFKAWAKARGFQDSELEGKMGCAVRAAYRASADYDSEDPDGQETKPAADDKEKDGKAKAARQLDVAATGSLDTANQGVALIQAESLRIAKVNAVCDIAAQQAEGDLAKAISDIRAQAIGGNWTEEKVSTQVELATLRASRAPQGHENGRPFNIHTGIASDNKPINANDVLASAMALSCGIPERIALTHPDGSKLDEREGNAASSGRFRNMGFQKLMGIVAQAHGIDVPGGPIDQSTLNLLIRAERRLDILGAGEGYSTVSLLGITENIMNKALLVGYNEEPSIVEDIAYQRDTNDFKQFKTYRMTGSGRMQLVNSAGELNSFGLQDESYPNQVQTRGYVLTITRQTIINDDLGAVTDAPKALGREGAQCREEQVMTTLLANLTTLFPVNNANGNYLSGATTSLTASPIVALTAAVKAFMEQTDANGRPIRMTPDRLIVPPALWGAASEVYKGTAGAIVTGLITADSAGYTKPNVNIHAGSYRPIQSAYLAARAGKGLTGASDTGWFLLPNPSGGFAVVQVGYLRGQRTPIIERGEAPFTTLGIQMRCYYDFGVATMDYRAGVYSKGSA